MPKQNGQAKNMHRMCSESCKYFRLKPIISRISVVNACRRLVETTQQKSKVWALKKGRTTVSSAQVIATKQQTRTWPHIIMYVMDVTTTSNGGLARSTYRFGWREIDRRCVCVSLECVRDKMYIYFSHRSHPSYQYLIWSYSFEWIVRSRLNGTNWRFPVATL